MANTKEPKDGTITEIDLKNGVIWYAYKGDEIAWNGTCYLSKCSLGTFKTLDDMDNFWENYFKAFFS